MSTTSTILDGYVKESVFAAANNISHRTSARYRLMGMPYLVWGGGVYVHVDGAREWLLSQTRRRNQPRAKTPRAATVMTSAA
jgi:hypothetical protein